MCLKITNWPIFYGFIDKAWWTMGDSKQAYKCKGMSFIMMMPDSDDGDKDDNEPHLSIIIMNRSADYS
jgi:hypothetical protein